MNYTEANTDPADRPPADNGWCQFRGFGQWDCDDAPCDYEASFVVDAWPEYAFVCVRHLGYAVGALTLHGSPRAIVSRQDKEA